MEIKLRIGDREFAVPIRLLLGMARNFPGNFLAGNDNYAALADALINLNLASVNQALASSRHLKLRQKKFLLEHGDIDTKRILLEDQALVRRLETSQLKSIMALNDGKMLENLAKALYLPENPRELLWTDEAVIRDLVERLLSHPNSEVRKAVLGNSKIPAIYFPSPPAILNDCGEK